MWDNQEFSILYTRLRPSFIPHKPCILVHRRRCSDGFLDFFSCATAETATRPAPDNDTTNYLAPVF